MQETQNLTEAGFQKKYWFTTKRTLYIVLGLLVFFLFPRVLFLIFGGILFSIFLAASANILVKYLKFKYRYALACILILYLGLTILGLYFILPNLSQQIDQLTKDLPAAFAQLKDQVAHYSWAQQAFDAINPSNVFSNSSKVIKNATSIFTNFIGLLANGVIIFFVGLYCSIEPHTYKNGLLCLFPEKKRSRVKEVLEEVDHTLKWWLIGKLFGMFIIGLGTLIGLKFLDIPLAFILAFIASVLTFIPNIGPILASIPGILLGFTQSPQTALYVGILYLSVQIVESYFLTPLVQRKTISLPPALTLSVQVILGVSIGGIGVALAAPFTAMSIDLVKKLYIEDTLNK